MITVNERIDNNWKELVIFTCSNPSQHSASFWIGTIPPDESSTGHPFTPGASLVRELFEENDRFWFRSNIPTILTVTR